METTLAKLLPSALTAALEQPTKEQPISTKDWADWLKINLHDDVELGQLVDACAKFLTAFRSGLKPRWLSILGNSGTGKTHCGQKVLKFMLRRPELNWADCEYVCGTIYWPGFISELRSGNGYEKLRDMQRWPVLFLDDICAERDTTGFASEQLNTLLGCRDGKWTILTSNLALGQIAKVEPRIADRIIRQPNILVDVNTQSYALRNL